jgi:GGDEF domain-containing protein
MEIGDEPLPSEAEWNRLREDEDLSVILLPPLHARTVTASIGVTIRSGSVVGGTNPEITATLLDNADTALYRAKPLEEIK